MDENERAELIRRDIENIIAYYVLDNGLKDTWWSDPQECVDELVKYIIKLLGETK